MRTTQVIDIKAADILTLYQYLIDKWVMVDKLFDEIKERAQQFRADSSLSPMEAANLNALNFRIETIQKAISAAGRRSLQDSNATDITLTDLYQLPNEIWLHIFSFLSFQDQLPLLTVSKQARDLALMSKISSQYIYFPKLNLIFKTRNANMPPITLADALELKSEISNQNDNLINEIDSLENKTKYCCMFCPTADSPSYAKNTAFAINISSFISTLLSITSIVVAGILHYNPKKNANEDEAALIFLMAGIGLLTLTAVAAIGMKKIIKQIENHKNRPLHTIKNNLTLFASTKASNNSHSINEDELQQVVIHH